MSRRTKANKISEKELLRQLIKDYGIVFEGPRPPQQWPSHYADVFSEIHNIGRVRFDEYSPGENRGLLTVAQVKDRVVALTEMAYHLRQNRDNEQTWRLETEPLIMSRFNDEVACRNCQKRLWISEIQMLPEDPDRAKELLRRRELRELCTCSPTDRAREGLLDVRPKRVFANRAGARVVYEASEQLLDKGVKGKGKEPDRVFGLAHTVVLNQHIVARWDIRHSPFADGKILYPFLTIEAKSEKGSPGFESVETQTAFPIRTFLQLQQNLSDSTRMKMDPLVWFFAYQGDEWRVYACVVDRAQFRIFDLWHGNIQSHDCALQLFLIVDCICDWARDTYRFDILRCLSGGELDPREMTPCYNVSSLRTGSKVALESRSPEPAESLSRPPTALPLISLISDSGSDSDLDSELSQLEEFLQEIDSTMLKIANSEDSPAPAKSSSRLPVAIDPISLISDLESDLDPDSDSDSQLGRRRQAFHQEIDSIMLDTDDSEDDHAAWVKHQLAFFDLPRPFGLSPDRSLISKESLESLGLSSDASSSTATGTGRYSCGSHSKTSSTSSPPGCRPWVNQW